MRYSPRAWTRRRELSRRDDDQEANQIWNEQSRTGDGDSPGGEPQRAIIADIRRCGAGGRAKNAAAYEVRTGLGTALTVCADWYAVGAIRQHRAASPVCDIGAGHEFEQHLTAAAVRTAAPAIPPVVASIASASIKIAARRSIE
ncbi:MAG: hypothetical protein ACREQR_04365 [Candidatus Binataceae bacterium]